jgi:transcriptional regulator with XRE-family HTH domain
MDASLSSLSTDLAASIRAARLAANLTQDELAQRIGVSMRTVQGWEAGDVFPRANHRRALVQFFTEEAAA